MLYLVGSILSSKIVNRYYHYAIDCCTFGSMAIFLRERKPNKIYARTLFTFRIQTRAPHLMPYIACVCNSYAMVLFSFHYYVVLRAFGCVHTNYTVIHCNLYLHRIGRMRLLPLYSRKVIRRRRYLTVISLWRFSSPIRNSKCFEVFRILNCVWSLPRV